MIRFTVVTITYNAEAVLQRTLDSVLRQTYEEVEHLIIDGARTVRKATSTTSSSPRNPTRASTTR